MGHLAAHGIALENAAEAHTRSFRAAGLIEREEQDYQQPIVPPGRFGTIVVDPPWDMQKIERKVTSCNDVIFGTNAWAPVASGGLAS